jgi:hypothetical protein
MEPRRKIPDAASAASTRLLLLLLLAVVLLQAAEAFLPPLSSTATTTTSSSAGRIEAPGTRLWSSGGEPPRLSITEQLKLSPNRWKRNGQPLEPGVGGIWPGRPDAKKYKVRVARSALIERAGRVDWLEGGSRS